MSNDLLTPEQVAEMFTLSTNTLKWWRCKGKGPAYTKVGGRIRYEKKDVERFITQSRVESGKADD